MFNLLIRRMDIYAIKESTMRLSMPIMRQTIAVLSIVEFGVPHSFPGSGATKAGCRVMAIISNNVKVI